MINILVCDAAIASFCVIFLHQANTPMGPPEDFQRSHHPYVAEAEESKLMPWRITDCMWRVFCRRTFINISWQLNGNWFCKNEKRSFKTIQQGGLVSAMPEVCLWSPTALIFISSSLGKMTTNIMILGRVTSSYVLIFTLKANLNVLYMALHLSSSIRPNKHTKIEYQIWSKARLSPSLSFFLLRGKF